MQALIMGETATIDKRTIKRGKKGQDQWNLYQELKENPDIKFDQTVNMENGRPDSLKNLENLAYRLKNKVHLNYIIDVNGKHECPFCKIKVKNVHIHF